MIIGAEIGLLIYGIIAMIRGQYSMGKGKKVIGSKARFLAAVCMVPIPLSMIAGFLVGFVIELFIPGSTSSGKLSGMMAGIEAAILVCTIIALMILSKKLYKQQENIAR